MQYSPEPAPPPAVAVHEAPAGRYGRAASPSRSGAIYRMGTVTRIFL